MQSEYKITLAPVLDESHEILAQAKQALGFVPNMYSNMATVPGLLESYFYGYLQFREHSAFTALEQEVVFLTISRENACNYCVAAHSVIADNISKVPVAVTDAIRDDKPVGDPKLAALHQFTQAMFRTRGLPTKADVSAFIAAGYSERNILDIVTAIAVKTISNYSNHLFYTELDDMFKPRAWEEGA